MKRFAPWLLIPASPFVVLAFATEAYKHEKEKSERKTLIKNTVVSLFTVPVSLFMSPFKSTS